MGKKIFEDKLRLDHNVTKWKELGDVLKNDIKEEWTSVKGFKFVGDDMHITTQNGKQFILKDTKIDRNLVDDELLVEEPLR